MTFQLPFVYLASQPYSGSTLLSILVNTHPEMATVGEMTGLTKASDPYEYPCSCGAKIIVCPFWRAVRDAMRSRGHLFDVTDFQLRFELGTLRLTRHLRTGSLRSDALENVRDAVMKRWRGYSQSMHALGARNQAFAESVLEVTGKRVFFDASKYHMAIKYLRRYAKLDLKVVHLVRDVRGATASLMRHNPNLDLRCAVRKWINGNRNIERQLAHLPSRRQIKIRYEELCQDPEATLRCLFRFCGVDPKVALIAGQVSPGCIVGNSMRLQGIPEIEIDERWKQIFSRSQMHTIERMAGDMHGRLGYPPMLQELHGDSTKPSHPSTAVA